MPTYGHLYILRETYSQSHLTKSQMSAVPRTAYSGRSELWIWLLSDSVSFFYNKNGPDPDPLIQDSQNEIHFKSSFFLSQ